MADRLHSTRTFHAVTVRTATAADATETASVWRAAWLDGHRDHVSPALLAARDEAYFSERATALSESTLLAENSRGQVAGLAIVTADELVQLAVDRSMRRCGVGAALLRAAETRIAATHEEAWLAVVSGNGGARDLYEKHGWSDTGDMVYHARAQTGSIPVLVRRYTKPVRVGVRAAS